MTPDSSSSAIQRLAEASGLTPDQVQALGRTFPEWLDFSGGDGGSADDLARLLRWMHDLLHVKGRSTEWVRDALLRANGGLRFISLASGKGGVGKTTCAVNLAFAMASLGSRVLLVDADLGLGNVHVFAGVNPTVTIQDFLDERLSLAAAMCPVAKNLWALCGGSGVASLAALDPARLNRLLRHLRRMGDRVDVVLIDIGSGLSPQVLGFLMQSQEIVVVSTPNIAAVLDAGGMIKTIQEKGMPGRVRLLINQSPGESEARDVVRKVAACAGQEAPGFLGFLTRDDAIEDANQNRRPFITGDTSPHNARHILGMALALTQTVPPPAS